MRLRAPRERLGQLPPRPAAPTPPLAAPAGSAAFRVVARVTGEPEVPPAEPWLLLL